MLQKLTLFYNKYINEYTQFSKNSKRLLYINDVAQDEYDKVEALILKNEINLLCTNDLENLSRCTRLITLCFDEKNDMQEMLEENMNFILKNKWKYKIAHYIVEALCFLGMLNKIK